MSIINDALKKVQHGRGPIGPSQNSNISSGEPVLIVKKENLVWGILILGGLIVLGCITVIIFINSLNKQMKVASVRPNVAVPAPIAYSQKAPAALPIATTAQPVVNSTPVPPGTLVLNGIIFSKEEQLALINDQIYKVGDQVEGKQIISISKDKVEITDRGKVITLSTKITAGR